MSTLQQISEQQLVETLGKCFAFGCNRPRSSDYPLRVRARIRGRAGRVMLRLEILKMHQSTTASLSSFVPDSGRSYPANQYNHAFYFSEVPAPFSQIEPMPTRMKARIRVPSQIMEAVLNGETVPDHPKMPPNFQEDMARILADIKRESRTMVVFGDVTDEELERMNQNGFIHRRATDEEKANKVGGV